MLFFQKTLADISHTVHLRYGHYGSSNSLKAHVTLDVQLATYARSPGADYKRAHLPNPISWAGHCWKRSKTNLCIKARYVFVVSVAVSILHLLEFPILTPFSPPMPLVAVPNFGNSASMTTHWKGDSNPHAMSISQISLSRCVSPLLSLSLASSSSSLRPLYEAWKAGSLAQAMLADTSTSASISAYFCGSLGLLVPLSSRSSLSSLWKVSSVVAAPGTSPVRSLHGRSRSRRTFKRPLVHLRPGRHGSLVVTGASPGSLSARCVAFTVSSLFNNCSLCVVL